jgi:NADH-quinone oxidoreductase subunit H
MNESHEAWIQILGLSDQAPGWLVSVLVFAVAYFAVSLPLTAVLVGLERKFAASVQARIGPNLTGPRGLLQSLADFLKLLQKQSRPGWFAREDFWLVFVYASMFSLLAVLPLGSIWVVVDSEMSAFLPILVAVVLAFGTLMLGIEQGTVYGFFGGLRFAAGAVGATVPAIVSVLSVGLCVGGFDWKTIVSAQGVFPGSWNIAADPFQWLAFLVFFCVGPMLFGLQGLDASTSRVDLNRGVGARLHGIRLALFKIREVYGLFFWSVLAVVLFFGAWQLPEGLRQSLVQAQAWGWIGIIEFAVLALKSLVLVFIYLWISVANPRVRADQLTDFGWRVLSPVSLLSLLGSAFWLAWRAGP